MNKVLLVFSIIILIINFSCSATLPIDENFEKVNLVIDADSAIRKPVLTLRTNINNSGSRNAYILTMPDFSTANFSLFRMVIKKNGKEMELPELAKRRLPTKSDYIKMKPNQTASFNYDLDVRSLIYSIKDVEKHAPIFGTYQIQVFYHDKIRKKRKAVRDMESNVLEVTFLP